MGSAELKGEDRDAPKISSMWSFPQNFRIEGELPPPPEPELREIIGGETKIFLPK